MSDKEPNYTPDRTAVRAAYVRDELGRDRSRHAHGGPPPLTTDQYALEFERWLNGQLAVAYARGRDEAKEDAIGYDYDFEERENPYG